MDLTTRVLAAVALFTISAPVFAADIRIEASPCANQVHVKLTDARLSDVLKRLADQMQFTLKFDPDSDTQVTFERRADPTTVLRELLNGGNFLQINEPRESCEGQPAIAQVWVLPRGEAVPYLTYIPEPKGVTLQPFNRNAVAPEVAPSPRGTRRSMSEADWQQMKQDYKDGRIAGDPETGKPIPIEEYRARIKQKEESQ